MRYTSQYGRTMLETIMVMGIMGVLSVVGIYMYRQAMNDVRADGVVKDVLARASQKKGNLELSRSGVGKKMVYTPEYKKGDSEKTKGRYGYTFEIKYNTAEPASIPVLVEGHLTKEVCNSIKGKVKVYKEHTFSEIKVVGGESNGQDILTSSCPDEMRGLEFVVPYGTNEYRGPEGGGIGGGGGGVDPEPALDCPPGSSKDGMGELTSSNWCRCDDPTAHWDGARCVVCEDPTPRWDGHTCLCPLILPKEGRDCNTTCGCRKGAGECNVDGKCCKSPLPDPGESCNATCGCSGEGECKSGTCVCPPDKPILSGNTCVACPSGSSFSGTGEETNVAGCRCEAPKTHWNVSACVCPETKPTVGEHCNETCGCSTGTCTSGTCTVTCPSGSSPSGTGDETNVAGCKCEAPNLYWDEEKQECRDCKVTNQGTCCKEFVERTDGTFDCSVIDYANSYNHASVGTPPYRISEFKATYKQQHNICLDLKGVDDDVIIKVGDTEYGPYWNSCLGLSASITNAHNFSKKYVVPANKTFEIIIYDICASHIGINYTLRFCD